ncbi:MAG: lipopolysaccharide heptosyltransferase I [Phycisphaerales bacterium]|nr:lipopolysaccharide heptosyltransferase I [Phycisphaerales bacterium]
MSDLRHCEFQRILIIKPSSPGDIIHALPVLRGLRRRYPNAHIAWLVATSFVNLLDADPALDEVIPFDRRRFGRLGRSLTVNRDFRAFLKKLRARRFDLVIDLQGLFRSGFFSYLCGAANRIGFRDAREFAWLFYNHKITRLNRDKHAADKNYAVAKMLGFDDKPLDFTVAIDDNDRQNMEALLAKAGIRQDTPTRPYAVLVPGTRWETKCWPVDRYGRLAHLIDERHGMKSILVGGASDIEAGNEAVEKSGGSAYSLCGQTTLRQLAALIDRASVVVTGDSTPMHIAAAHGRPLVALFGPTNPDRTGPYGRRDDVVRLDLECSPCYYRKLRQCPNSHACMQDLDVTVIAEAVDQRLLHRYD